MYRLLVVTSLLIVLISLNAPRTVQEQQKSLLADLYANRAVAAAASSGRPSPVPTAHRLLDRDASQDSITALELSHRLQSRQPLLPPSVALDYLRSAIPNPTPVKPSEDARMHLLTLNPREFFKYRYEKPIPEILQPPSSALSNDTHDSMNTPVSLAGSVIDTTLSSGSKVLQGYSGLLWIHLLAGRGLRATPPSAAVNTSTAAGQPPTTSAASSVSNTPAPSSAATMGPGLNRDLYCVIECDRVHKARTVVRSGESSFDWDEVFELDIVDCKEVCFLLYSWDPEFRHKLCYKGIVNLVSLNLNKTPVHSLALKMEPRGTLYIKMRYKEPAIAFQRPLPTPPPSTALFGVDLEIVVNRENSGAGVPLILKRCVEEVEKRGLDLVGIYRLCGSAVRKKMLREAFEKNPWLVDLSAEHVPDINVITSEYNFITQSTSEFLFCVLSA